MTTQRKQEELHIIQKEKEEVLNSLADAMREDQIDRQQLLMLQLENEPSQQELIRLKQDFDSTNSNIRRTAREKVFNIYKPLVNRVMEKYYSDFLPEHREELIQQGNIGIITGFSAYKPMMGGVFVPSSEIILRYIRYEMRAYILPIQKQEALTLKL